MLRLVPRGMSNAEIADELFLVVQTVSTHVGAVPARLGARVPHAGLTTYEGGPAGR